MPPILEMICCAGPHATTSSQIMLSEHHAGEGQDFLQAAGHRRIYRSPGAVGFHSLIHSEL